jgi:hypothetical protein
MIVLIRLPLALIATLAILVFYFLFFLVELPAAIVVFPFAAAVANRDWLSENWPGTFPCSLRHLFSTEEAQQETRETPVIVRMFGGEPSYVATTVPAGGMNVLGRVWEWAFCPD